MQIVYILPFIGVYFRSCMNEIKFQPWWKRYILDLKFSNPIEEKAYREQVWRENARLLQILSVGTIFHSVYVIIVDLTTLSQFITSYNYIVLFGCLLFFSLLITTMSWMSPTRHIVVRYVWFTVLSFNSLVFAFIVVIRDLLCYIGLQPVETCLSQNRPLAANLYLYATLGPIIAVLVYRVSRPIQLTFTLIFVALLVCTIALQSNNFQSWAQFCFIIGVYICIYLISYVNENNLRTGYTYALKAEKLATQLQQQSAQLQDEMSQKVLARKRELIAEEARKNFTNYIFHEIRVPLNTVILSSNLLEGDEDFEAHISSEHLDIFKRIPQELGNIETILNDTLDFRKMSEGKIQINLSPFSFVQLVRDIIWTTESSWLEKNITFINNFDNRIRELPFQLIGDQNRIRQVITNYMSNAVKFTKRYGYITLNTNLILLDNYKESVRIRVEVVDTGIGISKENQSKLFQPFVQIDANKNQDGRGSGLGLSICAAIIHNLNGQFGVDSQENIGSTFWFEVNFSISTIPKVDEIIKGTPVTEKKNPMDRRNYKILVIDDDKQTRTIMMKIFQKLGHTPFSAFDGQDGLEKYHNARLKGVPFDVIFCDNLMPRLTGKDFILNVRKDNMNIPIVSLTGSAETEIQEGLLNAGATKILIKPCSLALISKTMDFLPVANKKRT